MMKHKSFAAFILTHGRPDRVHTIQSLQKHGYTGKVILLVDDEDKSRAEYERLYPGMVEVFSKAEFDGTFDIMDNFKGRNCVVYARNACFGVAKKLGYKHFIQLDDDYVDFRYKTDAEDQYCDKEAIKQLDRILDLMIDFLDESGAYSVAMAQTGDFIGGLAGSPWAKKLPLLRKCMNTFVCRSDKPFTFTGRINEDVNAYVAEALRGNLLFTTLSVAIQQKQTQSNAGGLTDIYLELGTYVKSFYSVMLAPACVKVVEMGAVNRRLHHKVQWRNAAPKILDESLRKPRPGDKKKKSRKAAAKP